METIALRFSENFAPEEGTILAHEKIIQQYGYVWYGKLGSKIGQSMIDIILKSKSSKILLINSGKQTRYWAYVDEITYECEEFEKIPGYYRDKRQNFNTWFKIVKFEQAPKDILSKCFVTSSKRSLSEASKRSMSPYFKIEYNEEDREGIEDERV